MRLEGTLDAFSLPDIFQLLSFTKKTGTLHLRREASHGVVHLRDGAVTGARSDVSRQALGRRIVGAGLVDDRALDKAAHAVSESVGLGKALLDLGELDRDVLAGLAREHATDAVFDLLRWPDGEFAFVVDETDPDDLSVSLEVEAVVTEARARLEAWPAIQAAVPSPQSVVSLVARLADDPTAHRDEWSLLALVDDHRTVADLVDLSGRGEYAVVKTLSELASRGLVTFGAGAEAVRRRQQLLAGLEGRTAPAEAARPAAVAEVAAPPAPVVREAPVAAPVERKPVIPERPEPFTPPRQPEHVEEVPVHARTVAAPAASVVPPAAPSSPAPPLYSAPPTQRVAQTMSTLGSAALAPAPVPSGLIERDPSVNKSLLLRLIAGVRGL